MTIQGEDKVFTLLVGIHECGFLQSVEVKTQGIHQDITNGIDFRQLGTFACSYRIRPHASSEEQVGESVDNKTIDFLWHLDIEGTSACHEVSQTDALLLRHNGSCHR